MNKVSLGIITLSFLVFSGLLTSQFLDDNTNAQSSETAQAFLIDGLITNTSKTSIPLEKILNGGPGKDGIPSIDLPTAEQFDTVDSAASWLADTSLGVLVTRQSKTRYYPYDILYWHEIINDTLNDENIAVTFCPLCGSAITYNREDFIFGVSGKLWQSNLLMYDKNTESLWSQIKGRAVTGDLMNETLKIVESDIIPFSEVQENHPTAKVLNTNTGYTRDYGKTPYGTYASDDAFYFPVDTINKAFHPKELFLATKIGDANLIIKRDDILNAQDIDHSGEGEFQSSFGVPYCREASESMSDNCIIYIIRNNDQSITIMDILGKTYPHYTTMWFSWANHNKDMTTIWTKSGTSQISL